jgi:hypothetical protein
MPQAERAGRGQRKVALSLKWRSMREAQKVSNETGGDRA